MDSVIPTEKLHRAIGGDVGILQERAKVTVCPHDDELSMMQQSCERRTLLTAHT